MRTFLVLLSAFLFVFVGCASILPQKTIVHEDGTQETATDLEATAALINMQIQLAERLFNLWLEIEDAKQEREAEARRLEIQESQLDAQSRERLLALIAEQVELWRQQRELATEQHEAKIAEMKEGLKEIEAKLQDSPETGSGTPTKPIR